MPECTSLSADAEQAVTSGWLCVDPDFRDLETADFRLPAPAAGGLVLVVLAYNRDGVDADAEWQNGADAAFTLHAPGRDKSMDWTNPAHYLGPSFPLAALAAGRNDDGTPVSVGSVVAVSNACDGLYSLQVSSEMDSVSVMVGLVPEAEIPFSALPLYDAETGQQTAWTRPPLASSTGTGNYVTASMAVTSLAGGANTLLVPLSGDWATQGYLVRKVTVQFRATDAAEVFVHPRRSSESEAAEGWVGGSLEVVVDDGRDVAPCYRGPPQPVENDPSDDDNDAAGTSDAAYTVEAGSDVIGRVWRAVGPRSSSTGQDRVATTTSLLDGVYAQLTLPALADIDPRDAYDWADNQLFVDVEVAVTVEEYPTVGSTGVIDVRSRRSATEPYTNFQIFMWQPPSHLVWHVDVSASVTYPADAGQGDAPLGVQPGVSFGFGDSNFIMRDSLGEAVTSDGICNPTFMSGCNTPSAAPIAYDLGIYTKPYVPKMFFRVARGGCPSAYFNVALSVTASELTGECVDYTDCYAPEDSHPSSESDRDGDSAVGDTDHFVYCTVGIDYDASTAYGSLVPTTICTECKQDCDCDPGQYCHGDRGLCSNSGVPGVATSGQWVCDAESGRMFGLCREKDTSVLGSRCRPGATAYANVYSAIGSAAAAATVSPVQPNFDGFYPVTSPDSTEDVAVTDADWERADLDGYGFCGEVRYYNTSNAGVPASMAGAARATLWSGVCYDFECRECTEGQGSCGNARVCIDGSVGPRLRMDGTPRTYTNNVVAGTALGATFMVILLQAIVVMHLCCANRADKAA